MFPIEAVRRWRQDLWNFLYSQSRWVSGSQVIERNITSIKKAEAATAAEYSRAQLVPRTSLCSLLIFNPHCLPISSPAMLPGVWKGWYRLPIQDWKPPLIYFEHTVLTFIHCTQTQVHLTKDGRRTSLKMDMALKGIQMERRISTQVGGDNKKSRVNVIQIYHTCIWNCWSKTIIRGVWHLSNNTQGWLLSSSWTYVHIHIPRHTKSCMYTCLYVPYRHSHVHIHMPTGPQICTHSHTC